uniref:Uncharacterized protein n=1 Tax=Poecilia formosa TaxID=48698 RepID=A0A096M023_POEFO
QVDHLKENENEDKIKTVVKELVKKLKEKPSKIALCSNTICVSHGNNGNSKHSVRHYGVSMSTTGGPAGQIMVAASCLKYWEKDVADAVMSYYPKGKKYFNVTIKLPDWVRCQAFELTGSGEVKIPCRSCSNMFGLVTTATQAWPHGNCAEAESLSNLLKEKE